MPTVRARKSPRRRAGLSDSPRRPGHDKDGRAERREAILDAALAEFSARGFAAARLDDIAGRAGVAKGTLYLYFRDKETLFKELIRSRLSPLVGTIRAAAARDLSVRALVEMILHVFVTEIFGTSRKDIIALIISRRLQQAVRSGELRHDALARFPQLLIAPALVAVLWSALFDRFSPLDAKALMRAHLDVLFPERSGT
jgi:AcrR family transcriptional regulator